MHGVLQQQQLRVYAIVGGRVYRQPPLRDVLLQRLAEALSDLSICADLLLLQLCCWTLPCGFSWRAPLSRKRLLMAQAAANKYCAELHQQQQQQQQQQGEQMDSEDAAAASSPSNSSSSSSSSSSSTSSNASSNSSKSSSSSSRVKVVYRRPLCAAAARVLEEERKRLTAEAQKHEAQRVALTRQWGEATAAAAAEAAQLQQQQQAVSKLRSLLLQAAPNPHEAAALLQQLKITADSQ
ncbi:hypothetical protein, conserved [Eimeria tenella]|uniref:Uncharacterized protein n=1 Tax=Eimeria tenella TaxID=5802 RepID=U6L239_EIMTE|nr:hypothetical protein, conserved [Eimeria tenella]CDJ44437.1 hypothetical protein, conserved [Eimeria tenella]|eukprot:XP_013235186.1 hypothetical protein, conserved [Eimeria tenella]